PLVATAVGFAILLANQRGLFSPDRVHIHPVLIDYWGLTHKQASFLIGCFNILFVVLFVILGSKAKNTGMVIMLVGVVIFLTYIFFQYNYNFTTLKQKIRLKRKIDSLKGKNGDLPIKSKKNGENKNEEKKNNGEMKKVP